MFGVLDEIVTHLTSTDYMMHAWVKDRISVSIVSNTVKDSSRPSHCKLADNGIVPEDEPPTLRDGKEAMPLDEHVIRII